MAIRVIQSYAMKVYFALGSMLALCAAASANLLTNGDFEATTFSSPYETLTGNQLQGWTIFGGNVAGIVPGYLNAPSQEIDLSGTVDVTPGTSGISQTVTTTAGKYYYVSFDVYAGPATGYTGGVDLLVGGNLVASNVQGNRSTVTYTFKGNGSDLIEFRSSQGNVSHIDNASIVATPAPGAMIAFGLSAVGARVRRRRSAK